MDVDVLTSREIEIEVRFRRVQTGALEAVQANGELLQVLHIPHLTPLLILIEINRSK
jgi:hypothetical protein